MEILLIVKIGLGLCSLAAFLLVVGCVVGRRLKG